METAQTLDRGLLILSILADSRDGLTVSQVAREVGISRTVAYRLIATLDSRGFVRRSPDGRYRLGFESVRLSSRLEVQLREVCQGPLRGLADSLGVTAYLAVADGADAVIVAAAEPTGADFSVLCRVGARIRLGECVAGRAILKSRAAESGAIRPPDRLARGPHGVNTVLEGFAVPVRLTPGVDAAIGVVGLSPVEVERTSTALIGAALAITAAVR